MVQVITMPKNGGYKPQGNLAFEPYQVMCKRLGLTDQRNKGPLSLIPESENVAHRERQRAYWTAIAAEEAAKQVHTCGSWTYDVDDESPAIWCPGCHHAEWKRHSRAGQQLIVDAYMAEHYPVVVKPVQTRIPTLTRVTALQKTALETGGTLALMTRDQICNNMRPFWYYCEREDSEWLTRKMAPAYVPMALPAAAPAPAPEPAFFARSAALNAAVPVPALTADTDARMRRYTAWAAQERRKERRPFFRGAAFNGSCAPNDNKVVLKNLPLNEATLQADMWEIIAQVAPVVDVYQPKAMFITLLRPADVDAVLNAFPAGFNYNGSIVRVERASGRR